MPDHPNEVEAVPKPDPVVTIVVGDGRVTPGESPQDGLDVRAGLICSHRHSDLMVTRVCRDVRARKDWAVARVCPFERESPPQDPAWRRGAPTAAHLPGGAMSERRVLGADVCSTGWVGVATGPEATAAH